MRQVTITACLLYLAIASNAQHEGSSKSIIQVRARSYGDSIVLRWAPTSATAWQLLNKYGYRIERYTIVRDSVVLENKPVIQLNTESIKPAHQSMWEPLIDSDDIIALLAQAIYGDSFEIMQGDSSNVIKAITLSRELDLRYSFALFGSDVSAKASQLAGLRWVDTDVKKNERYLYRVYPLVPENISQIEFGFAYVSSNKAVPLPEPQPPVVSLDDNIVTVSVDAQFLKDFYTAYQIERSSDQGVTFTSMSRMPLVPMRSENQLEDLIIRTDSLFTIHVKYFYRVRGVSTFGEWGPYSKTVDITGKETVSVRGKISELYVTPENSISITWTFPLEEQGKIKGFDVERAPKENGPYIPVNTNAIPPTSSSYTDRKPLSTNYYRLKTIVNTDLIMVSNPFLIQLEDSIPPAVPTNLKAVMLDTTGAIRVSWAANKELDLLGYHIYRSNFKNSEFSRITTDPLAENYFVDTINIKNLSGKIYYKLTALDKRFNPSQYSSSFEVIKIDIIPPAPPAIKSIVASFDGIKICWLNSVSEDVESHELYRSENLADWKLVSTFSKDNTCYNDRPVDARIYNYKVTAKDKSNLKSYSQVVSVFNNTKKNYPTITIKNAKADRKEHWIELSWNYPVENIQKFLIYRSENESALTFYKSLSGDSHGFVDRNLNRDSNYTYRIKAIFKNGDESLLSDSLKLKY